MHISQCPRCGGSSLEHLRTHSICHECGFSPDIDSELGTWERLEFAAIRRRPGSKKWIPRSPTRLFGGIL